MPGENKTFVASSSTLLELAKHSQLSLQLGITFKQANLHSF